MAYIEQQETADEVISNMVSLLGSPSDPSPSYTPAASPEAQPSVSSSPPMPDFMTLSVDDALDYLLVPTDEAVELVGLSLDTWWESDSQHSIYTMFAPNWVSHIKEHVIVCGLNQESTQQVPGYQLCYLHSTTSTLRHMAGAQNLGG
eukprot:1326137-Amphidinium_carterae.1